MNTYARTRHHQGPHNEELNPQFRSHNQQNFREGSSKFLQYNDNPNNERYHHYQQGQQPTSQRQWYQHGSSQNFQNRKALTCGPCNRSFYSQHKLQEHLNDHVECPFPECKLSAHIKVIDQHISNQHMLVNFASLQIDDETWIAERKKRFPTAQRSDLRRAEQIEKLKRGERLGFNKKPFDKKNGDKSFKTRKNGLQHRKGNVKEEITSETPLGEKDKQSLGEKSSGHTRFSKRPRWERPPPPPRPVLVVDLYESDEEVLGVPHFKGTRQFYESTGELNYFSTNTLNNISPKKEIVISDDEEWEDDNRNLSAGAGSLNLGGALGSLMGAYSDSEEDAEDLMAKCVETKFPTTSVEGKLSCNRKSEIPAHKVQSELPATNVKSELIVTTPVVGSHNENGPILQEKGDSQSNTGVSLKGRLRRRPRPQKRGRDSKNTIHRPKRRKTLLERLLQADIIHERNIILQCVRYVVENDFFDNKATVKEEVEPTGSQEKKTISEVDPELKMETATCSSLLGDANAVNVLSNESAVPLIKSESSLEGEALSNRDKIVKETEKETCNNVVDNTTTESIDVSAGNTKFMLSSIETNNKHEIFLEKKMEMSNVKSNVSCNTEGIKETKSDQLSTELGERKDSAIDPSNKSDVLSSNGESSV